MFRPRLLPSKAAWLVIALLGFSPATSAEIAHIESLGVLYTIDLDTGEVEALGATGVEERFSSLAFDPRGRLFGIGNTATTMAALFELDPETGAATLVGELGFDLLRELTVTASGRFWASDGDQLFTVDPVTGLATPGAMLEVEIHALASLGDRLFAPRYQNEQATLFEVDPASGELTPVLEGAAVELPITDATFDTSGQLRLKTAFGGSLLGSDHAFVRIDLTTGESETTYETFTVFTDPLAGMTSLAIHSSSPPVEVPTLDRSALLVLVVLLALTGAVVLARRRSSGAG